MGNEASRTNGESAEVHEKKQHPRSPLRLIKAKVLENRSPKTIKNENEKENVVPDSTVEGDPTASDDIGIDEVDELEKTETIIDELDSPCSDSPLQQSSQEESSQSDTSSAQKFEFVNKDMVEDGSSQEPMEESLIMKVGSSRISYNLRQRRSLKQRYGRNSAAIQRGRKLKVITPRVHSKKIVSNQWSRKHRRGALLGLNTTTLIKKEDREKLFNPSKFAINGKFAMTLDPNGKEENKEIQIHDDANMEEDEEEKVDEILAEWEKEIARETEERDGGDEGDDNCDIKDEGQMNQNLETKLESSHVESSPSLPVSQTSEDTESGDQPDGLIHRNTEKKKKLSETELFQLHALAVVKEMAHFKGRQDWTATLLDMEKLLLS